MLLAFGHVFSWPGILIPILGTLLAMIASFLPGIGNASVAVMALVLSSNWDPVSVMLLFGALTGGATFMGSITAILFNIPGSVSSTAALLDGYPLARMGLTKTAIACAATASAVGSVFGVVVLLFALPAIRPYILAFGPIEILLVGVLGLLTVVSLPTNSKAKSAVMVGLGLLAAAVGSDPSTGASRWTLGSLELSSGLALVPVMLGIYTVGELLNWINPVDLKAQAKARPQALDSTWWGVRAVFGHLGLTFRSSWIGTLIGMVPGIGGTVAGFVAYGHAVQSSGSDSQRFGKGDVRGLIAPEAAVDAKDGGSLLPTLALGLPGSEACVILLAVFTMHGLVPGMPMLTTHLALSYTLIVALLFSNILTSIVGVAMAPALSRLSSLRVDLIALPCLLICLYSVILIDGKLTDLYVMIFFGIAGYYWRRNDWPTTPFVIAFVLGKLLETNFVLSSQLIELGRIIPSERFLAIALACLILIGVIWRWVKRERQATIESSINHSFAFAVVMALPCAATLVWSVAGGGRYSLYALVVAFSATALTLGYALQCWRRAKQGEARAVSDLLLPAPAHRLFLLVILAAAPGAWLVGFAPMTGLTTFCWKIIRNGANMRSVLSAFAWGVIVALACEVLLSQTGEVLLENGWLWRKLVL